MSLLATSGSPVAIHLGTSKHDDQNFKRNLGDRRKYRSNRSNSLFRFPRFHFLFYLNVTEKEWEIKLQFISKMDAIWPHQKTAKLGNPRIRSTIICKREDLYRWILSDVAITTFKQSPQPDYKTQTSPSWHRTKRPVDVDQCAESGPLDVHNRQPRFTSQQVKGTLSHGHGTSENYGPHISCRCRNYFLALAYYHVLWDVAASDDVYWVPLIKLLKKRPKNQKCQAFKPIR